MKSKNTNEIVDVFFRLCGKHFFSFYSISPNESNLIFDKNVELFSFILENGILI